MHIQEILSAIYANHTYEYIVTDETFRVIEFSDKAFTLCQKGAKECDKLYLFDIVPELYGIESIMKKILQGEKTQFTMPYIFREPDNYMHIHVHPGRRKKNLKNDENRFESLIILFENITDMAHTQQHLVQERNEKALLLDEIYTKNAQLKRFNEEMQKLVEEEIAKNMQQQKMIELQSRHAQMGEMIGMITHQWKQPLNVISLIVNVLKINLTRQSFSKEELEKKLDDVLKQVQFMDRTIMDFQSFFNPSKERIYFNIYENIQSIVDLVHYAYEHKNIDLVLKGDKRMLAYGYPNEFNQVILTLMNNAKDAYMENPAKKMPITITIFEKEGHACVTVKDEAGGISESVMDKLFELYVTTKKNGSGIGLNLAKHMVEVNMEGRLSVRNVDGGAELTVMLPIIAKE